MQKLLMLIMMLLVLLGLPGCGSSAFSYFEGGIITNSYGCRSYWDAGSFPITVVPDPQFDVTAVIKIGESLAMWNEAIGDEIFVLKPITSLAPDSEAILITKGQLGKNLLGITRTKYYENLDGRMGRISKVMIVLDVDHVASGDPLMIRTTAHELGHALGYYHDPEKESLMYPKMIGSTVQKLSMTHKVRTYNMLQGEYKGETALGTPACF